MKLQLLRKIVKEYASELKESAAYGGSHTDGGSDNLLCKLKDYENKWVMKLDLKPSEFSKLENVEVGEPLEFSFIIENYKINLVKNIKL